MIGIVIVSHGNLCESLVHTSQMILGKQDKILTVPLSPSEGLDDLQEKMREAIEELNSPEGVLILADMFGGSAANVSAAFLNTHKVGVVTGVNLPMLLESMLSRIAYTDVKQLTKHITEKSRGSIIDMGDIHKTCR
ncbi:MAG: PTS sugar transporter subunit IIA [Candidatus Firestonebacteria bacterium]